MAILDFLTRETRFSAALKALRALESLYDHPLLLLDAGGGLYTISPFLEKRGHKVIVCDNAVSHGRADVICNLEEGLPFDNRSFDVVVSLAVVEHLEKWEYALLEFKRVGRHVVLTTPSAWGESLLRLLLALKLVHPMTGDHKGYISRENLESLGYSLTPFLFGLNRLATFINHGGSET